MNTITIIGQVVGFAAAAIMILSFQFKKTRIFSSHRSYQRRCFPFIICFSESAATAALSPEWLRISADFCSVRSLFFPKDEKSGEARLYSQQSAPTAP